VHRLRRLRAECPVEAIFEESALPAEWKSFTQVNADYYKDK
jgi:hypothetical protein